MYTITVAFKTELTIGKNKTAVKLTQLNAKAILLFIYVTPAGIEIGKRVNSIRYLN